MTKAMKKIGICMLAVLAFLSFCGIAAAGQLPGKYTPTNSATLNPIAYNGMITTPHYLGTQAGMEVLRQGGNAIDAAIAAATTLTVVYPHMNSLGGDNFWVIYNAKTGEVRTLNASGRSGEKASIEFYKSKGITDKIPYHGYLAANTVPGCLSGWEEAHKYASANFSNKGLPWNKLFASAIGLAENGFPVGDSLSIWIRNSSNPNFTSEPYNHQNREGWRSVFLKADGSPYNVGEIIKMPDLASTYKLIAKDGAAKAFYRGPIAKKIVADLQSNGGILTEKDFAEHKADWVKPLSVDYRGHTIYNLPPNSQGMTSLQIMNILNNFDIKKMGEGTADYYHVIVEAIKEAFIDRDKYITDPDFSSIPTDKILSKAHGKAQAARIRMDKTSADLKPLDPRGDTIWLGVVDKDGNAVSLIQSIYFNFGSGVVPKGTGLILQNRGTYFSLNPKHVNRLEPKKRTFHTLNAAMLLKNNKPLLIYGTQGGDGQPQTHAMQVTRIIDFGMYPQDALAAPRFLYGRMVGTVDNDLKLEGRVPQAVMDELKRRGHTVVKIDDFTDTVGQSGAILIDQKTNVKYGASDPRSDGLAAGY
jgi:gamma-glutamyltranspeptidase/glutathione hydrolase